MKKLFVKTFGCQMNVYDSERISELLGGIGYMPASEPDDADMVVLNTCHIREKAAEKMYSELGRLKRLKDRRAQAGSTMLIAVAGCVAQAEGDEIIARQSAVDMVVGPQSYHRLPEMIARISRGAGHVLETEFPAQEKFDSLPEERGSTGPTAFLTVQEGCDKFCTFCVVPYTRGAEFSRPPERVLSEARQLASKGVQEITLLGQNVNAYRGTASNGESWTLARLIRALAKIGGIARLRYTTSHPRDMDADLIAAHGEIDALMPCLHLPVQSGSDRVLAAMNRQHTAAHYLEVAARVRAARPDIALSSDFIVGFPGETDADFESTLALVRQVVYAQAFSFKYSPRPGTPAAASPKQIPDDIKSARLTTLQQLLATQQATFNASCLGKVMPVLFEKPGLKSAQAVGRSPWLQPVHVEGARALVGKLRDVRIVEVLPNSLKGELVAGAVRQPVELH
ncbi:MAG TPA: tRNA (N6-isopentenyl adenosine(37)-C2)-methylthiotransferase MiaB [Rhizomicrobium sp.]|jgi:tRNA-2-methylthio-N6-dimethylallyladenosine synthase|nr:tRNA (N6-isopentenyl adenosine(37)-C2)-methylthiotransferase MiaB [Rhizomicrobium sp.]